MSDDLREGLEAGVGRVQDGLDDFFSGAWIKKGRARACGWSCGMQEALSDLVTDRPVLSVTMALVIGLIAGRTFFRRR